MGMTVVNRPTSRPGASAPSWRERWLGPLAWASLVANVLIVVTGGAVRLSGSGLGCSTWPRCDGGSYVPHGAFQIHQAIEFSNRMLTFALTAVAVATLVAAWRSAHRRLALVLLLGIPAQAVIGGISVLTDLNPWIVSFHLLCSMALVGVAVLLLRRLALTGPDGATGPGTTGRQRGALPTLAWLVFGVAWVVLYLGTAVTGSGPHAGDQKAVRNGLDPLQIAQAHADSVMLFVGLTVGLLIALRLPVLDATGEARRAAAVLLVVELAQAAIGFVQYFTHLPEVLVGFHMLGAALISAAVTWALLAVVSPVRAERSSPIAGSLDEPLEVAHRG